MRPATSALWLGGGRTGIFRATGGTHHDDTGRSTSGGYRYEDLRDAAIVFEPPPDLNRPRRELGFPANQDRRNARLVFRKARSRLAAGERGALRRHSANEPAGTARAADRLHFSGSTERFKYPASSTAQRLPSGAAMTHDLEQVPTLGRSMGASEARDPEPTNCRWATAPEPTKQSKAKEARQQSTTCGVAQGPRRPDRGDCSPWQGAQPITARASDTSCSPRPPRPHWQAERCSASIAC